MNAYDQIISKQVEWARNKGLRLIGSHGTRGRKTYTTSVKANLFQPLRQKTRENLEMGDGGELTRTQDRPARIQAVHSSSALGINLFDYWRGSTDVSLVAACCGLCRAGRRFRGEILFEQKFPIARRFRYSPNIDVVIMPESGRYRVFGIECKFTEAYSPRGHGGLDQKYFDNTAIWQNLVRTKRLAQEISPDDSRFEHLHAAQLIKHILSLNLHFGHLRYRLLYLWYDALGEAGSSHRKEIDSFAEVVRSDGVVFHERTYQDLILRLARYRQSHPEYVAYMTERYL